MQNPVCNSITPFFIIIQTHKNWLERQFHFKRINFIIDCNGSFFKLIGIFEEKHFHWHGFIQSGCKLRILICKKLQFIFCILLRVYLFLDNNMREPFFINKILKESFHFIATILLKYIHQIIGTCVGKFIYLMVCFTGFKKTRVAHYSS